MDADEIGREIEFRRLTTPRAAATAGILFALLFATSVILFRSAVPEGLSAETAWLEEGRDRIKVALGLMPFAGIAFLWFVGVVRDRLGEYEDQFFSTVFFGSGLLFMGLVFVAMGIFGGVMASTAQKPSNEIIVFGRDVGFLVINIYALRMAAVFMISLGTIWLRTGTMPRWLAIVTYLLALTLLVVINFSLWIVLIIPTWVLLISIFILARSLQEPS